jgi:hypothetical protein
MKPMGLNSTPFLNLSQIDTSTIDLYEDAFGLYASFADVISVLEASKPEPGEKVINCLLEKIRNQ